MPKATELEVALEHESWLHPEKNSSEKNIRNAVLRHRGNNCILAGWNLGLFFTALNIVVPEWTVIDLAADLYVREYLLDAVLHRGISGDLFDTCIWYPIDRRWLAIYSFADSYIELYAARPGEVTMRRHIMRGLFTAAEVRLFYRPMHRRYMERYFDIVYKQLVCGHGATLKALAVEDPRLLDIITSPGVVSTVQIGDEPKDVAEFVSLLRNDGGKVAEWRADPSLEEFVGRCADLPFVRQGFSDDPSNVPVYRQS